MDVAQILCEEIRVATFNAVLFFRLVELYVSRRFVGDATSQVLIPEKLRNLDHAVGEQSFELLSIICFLSEDLDNNSNKLGAEVIKGHP